MRPQRESEKVGFPPIKSASATEAGCPAWSVVFTTLLLLAFVPQPATYGQAPNATVLAQPVCVMLVVPLVAPAISRPR